MIFVLRQREYYERGDPNFRRVPSQVAPSANDMFAVQGYISLKDAAAVLPPDHCPKDVAAAFREGAKCLVIGAHNAAGSMFRLAIDLATKSMLPDPALPGGPNRQQRDKLAYRLDYLFDMGKIPVELRELAHSIREDGNDGAHDGTLEDGAAEDLQDFSAALLENLYATGKSEGSEEAARRAAAMKSICVRDGWLKKRGHIRWPLSGNCLVGYGFRGILETNSPELAVESS